MTSAAGTSGARRSSRRLRMPKAARSRRAGTGTVAFGFKGGIGTASRVVPQKYGGYTVGVLVQTNYGGVLTMNGAPVGRELGRYYLKEDLEPARKAGRQKERPGPSSNVDRADGSCIVVVATDAPLDARNLR